MPPERMSWGQQGMIEVVSLIVPHADFLHNAPRRKIPWDGESDDLFKLQDLEPNRKYRSCGHVLVCTTACRSATALCFQPSIVHKVQQLSYKGTRDSQKFLS
jgi:hypothetical protein